MEEESPNLPPPAVAGLIVVALGAAGWLVPGTGSGPWVWAGLWGPAGGVLASGLLAGRRGLVPLALGWGLLAACGPGPDPVSGATAGLALALWGWALGPRRGVPAAVGLALLVAGLCAALPALGGVAAVPLGPARTALLLDLSPVGLVLESAGLDWMRHASIYEAAGSGDLGPELRAARGGLGGPAVLAAAALALGLGRRSLARRSA